MPEPRDPDSRNRYTSDEQEEDGPIAVGGASWSEDEDDETAAEPFADPAGAEAQLPPGVEGLDDEGSVEKPGAELATGVACLALALSTFLPWYGAAGQTVSGFSSATWAPLIFFLGIAGALIVALRRFKVPIAFPVEHGTVLEGIGWVAVVGIILKRFYRPALGTFTLPLAEPYFFFVNGLMISLLCAVAVALLGGRLSAANPFMIKPGWLAGFAGKLGIAILGVSVLAGISFGFFNDEDAGQQVGAKSPIEVKTFAGKAPPCLKGIPIPRGVKITEGKDIFNTETKKRTACHMSFTMNTSLRKAGQRFEAALRRADIPFRDPLAGAPSKQQRSIVMTKPCGLIALGRASGNKTGGSVVITYEAVCPYSALTQSSPGSQ